MRPELRLPAVAPAIGGYNLCYLKPEATAVALSSDEHEAPLVALNRHGTGRAAVFTGEADGAERQPWQLPHGIPGDAEKPGEETGEARDQERKRCPR